MFEHIYLLKQVLSNLFKINLNVQLNVRFQILHLVNKLILSKSCKLQNNWPIEVDIKRKIYASVVIEKSHFSLTCKNFSTIFKLIGITKIIWIFVGCQAICSFDYNNWNYVIIVVKNQWNQCNVIDTSCHYSTFIVVVAMTFVAIDYCC